MAKAQTAVLLVDFEDHDLERLTDGGELGRVLDLLGPAQVADVDKTVDTFLKLHEDTEVGEIADRSGMFRVDGIFFVDGSPRIRFELLDTEAHLALLAVEGEDDGLHLLAHFEEILCAAQVQAPAHFGDVDQTFDTRLHFDKGTVVGDDHDLAFHLVAHLEVRVESVPRMRAQLLQTEGDALLRIVEVEDHDIDLLVELDHLFRMADAAPAQVGDVDQTVHAAQVDEHTVGGDVLDRSFQDLALLELADDVGLLGLDLSLDERLVGNDYVAEFLVDLDDLEFHGLVDVHIVVADGLDIDLAARQEGLDAEHVDDHATLRTALDVTLDDFVFLEGLVDTVPGLDGAGALVGEDELAFLVFRVLHVHFHGVADGEIRVVAEFIDADDTFALVTDVHDHFAFVDGGHGAFYDLIFVDAAQTLAVAFFVGSFLLGVKAVVFERIPVELVVVDRGVALFAGRFHDHLLFDLFCILDCRVDDLFRHD